LEGPNSHASSYKIFDLTRFQSLFEGAMTMPSFETELIAFNNAAVDFVEAGHLEIACELFRAALEMGENRQKLPADHVHSDQRVVQIISLAEDYLHTLDVCVEGTLSSWRRQQVEENSIMPFMYDEAFRIKESSAQDESCSFDTKYWSHYATILFNLALVYHLHDRSSKDAFLLYNLVSRIPLERGHDGLLGIALLNNMGVLCADNGDFVAASKCMNRLSLFLQKTDSQVCSVFQDGFLWNVMWLVAPPSFASPAA